MTYPKTFNFLLFQLGWFACVLGGDAAAVPVTILIVIVHLKFIGNWQKERELLAITLLLGSAVDSVLGNFDVLQFSGESRVLPQWLACLWLLFATTLRHSMDWSRTHKWLGALGGMIAGPLSYYAGAQLSNISLATPEWKTLLILSALWALIIPTLQTFSRVWQERYKSQGIHT